MFSYVFMKILEGRPQSYDRRMERLSGGRVKAIKNAVVEKVPPGARVLEIGCGTGQLARLLCAKDPSVRVEGFDANRAMVDVARQKNEEAGLGDRVVLRSMGVENMDEFADETYEVIVATLVFSELNDNERRYALKHAFRALRPGGRLVIADEVRPRKLTSRIKASLVRAPLVAATYLASGKTTEPLVALASEVAQLGFEIDEEQRADGDTFVLLVAYRPTTERES